MNPVHSALARLLSAAIRNQSPSPVTLSHGEWLQLYDLAWEHQIHCLICGAVQTVLKDSFEMKSFLDSWKLTVVREVTQQKQELAILPSALQTLSENHIDCIYLKGLAHSVLYPWPDLRITTDIDLLIHPEDLDRATEALATIGYQLELSKSIDRHLMLTKSGCMDIELHQHLLEDTMHNYKQLENQVWQNRQTMIILNGQASVPDRESTCLFMLLHMAQHMRSSGFGLKQLCDLVLFIEKHQMDLFQLEKLLAPHHMSAFFQHLIGVSARLLDLHTGEYGLRIQPLSADSLEAFEYAILSSGAFGFSEESSNRIHLYREHLSTDLEPYQKPGLQQYLSLIFPSLKIMLPKYKYHYLKKRPYLLPAAWIHRIIRLVLRKDYDPKTKYLFMFSGQNSAWEKDRLLKELGL